MFAPHEATMHNPEEQLVARCRTGDMEAFALVYARYERQVFRYAYHLLGHRDDADDVKQETFLRAYHALPKFRNDAGLQTWLLKICGNLCRDKIRSWERRKVTSGGGVMHEERPEAGTAADPAQLVEQSQTTDIVLAALHRLPPNLREVVVLHDMEGLEYAAIAAILGCTAASVKLRVYRARRRLKERVTAVLKGWE